MKPFNIFIIIFILEIFSEKLANSLNLKKNSVKGKSRKLKKQYDASFYPSFADSSNIKKAELKMIHKKILINNHNNN